ncbi:MAG: succinylglutamate desuccinylase/aspartoacylase family protein [Rubrivivax sp.]|nr:succinylglutamate desuccinylase/aspartoacylase family protein [Rubrivivax sp.]
MNAGGAATPGAPAAPAADTFELLPRDLAPYRAGNTGIPYVHRFDSGRPGPHVLVNALTHGNEFCGMVAATHLLDTGVRPKIGTLTVSFANVEAYESFDAARPLDSRQLVHNLNRIWSEAWLDGPEHSPELRRARELRPVVAAADHVLDLHSTSTDVPPFWVYPQFERNAAAALAVGLPRIHLTMPLGLGTGTPLILHGLHGQAGHHGVGLVAECGGHFRRASGEVARRVTMRFLAHFGLVEAEQGGAAEGDAEPPCRYELVHTRVVKTDSFRFARPLVGFETFARGELIATDGDEEIRAPCDDCTVMMPTRRPIVGREGVYLTRPMPPTPPQRPVPAVPPRS